MALASAPTTLNQPNFTNWTPLKPSAQSSSFGATAVAVPNSGTVNNSSSSPANENNNTLTTEDKLAKQNVKYDMSTGKVYEELGGSSGNNPAAVVTGASAPPGGTTNCNNASRTRSTLDYTPYGSSQQSYHSAAAASSYPYGNYMSSFSSPYATSPGSYPYDRTSMYSSYGASGPRAFVPHSAINLSVKTPELPDTATTLDLSMTDQTGTGTAPGSQFSSYPNQAGSSPQILDLTRSQEVKKGSDNSSNTVGGITNKTEQTEPVDFSSQTSAYTYTTTSASTPMVAGSFSTTESGNSSTTDTLNRYRSTNPVTGYSPLGLTPSAGAPTYSSYSSGYASYPQSSYAGYSSTFGMNPTATAYDQDALNSYGFVSGLTAAAAAISASSNPDLCSGKSLATDHLLNSVSRSETSANPYTVFTRRKDNKDLIQCPTPGCDGMGHSTGNYSTHRSDVLGTRNDGMGHPYTVFARRKDNKDLIQCLTPGCDGMGHSTGNYSTHRSLSGCPRANKPKSRPKDGTEAEPLRCPVPGCDGSGHSTGKFLSHRSASGCPLASKNKALREQLSGNVKYSNGSTPSFGNRLAALSNNSYDPEGLSQDKTSPNNDPNDEKENSELSDRATKLNSYYENLRTNVMSILGQVREPIIPPPPTPTAASGISNHPAAGVVGVGGSAHSATGGGLVPANSQDQFDSYLTKLQTICSDQNGEPKPNPYCSSTGGAAVITSHPKSALQSYNTAAKL